MDRADMDKMETVVVGGPDPKQSTATETKASTDTAKEPEQKPEAKAAETVASEKAEGDTKVTESKEEPGTDEKPNKATRQYQKLLRERAEARAEAKLLREENSRLAAGGQAPHQATPAPTDRPKRADYANPDDYDDAMAGWTENKINEAKESGRQAALVERRNTEVDKFITAEKAVHPDYDKVVNDMEVSEALFHYVRDEDNPAAVAYWLATHDEECERINTLTPKQMVHELGRISARIEYESKEPAKKTEDTRVSRAPAPVTETSPGKTEDKSIETDEEYALRWKKSHGYIPA